MTNLSQISALSVAFNERVQDEGALPLGWVRPTAHAPYPNLGDALSPIVASALSGLPIAKCDFDTNVERLVSVGTIAHVQRNGCIHMWGTGLDSSNYKALPSDTIFAIHAMRGPQSADSLRGLGIPAPEVYGDPVWFLPKILPRKQEEPKWDLGVIVHISELIEQAPSAWVDAAFKRYDIPNGLSQSVKIINTFTENNLNAIFAKIDEILSCKRIASTSFHGMVIADTYRIPCAWFGPRHGGAALVDPRAKDDLLDHRIADFYAGTSVQRLPAYCHPRDVATDWEVLMRWIDGAWSPVDYDATPLFSAFPVSSVCSFDDEIWPIRARAIPSLTA